MGQDNNMVTSPAPVLPAESGDEAGIGTGFVDLGTPVTGTALIRARPQATAMLFMKAGRPHEPVAVPQVLLGPADVLVEVEFATVCSSDIHTWQGRRIEPAPLVLGHEAVGRVVAIGGVVPALDGVPLVPGDRVVWSVAAHCGSCERCLRGIPQKCLTLHKYGHERIGQGWELTGGFATHVHLREGTSVVRVEDDMPASVLAPASCGTATAWAALAAAGRTRPLGGSTVLIVGGGLIGLAATAMARERGATVIVADPDEERRDLALRFGAAAVVDPAEGETAAAAFATARFAGRSEVDIVIETTGSPLAFDTGFDAVGIGGVLVLAGSVFPTEPVPVLPERIVRSLVSIVGVHNYTPEQLRDAVGFLREHWHTYPFERFVGRVYPLIDVDSALDRAALHREVRVGVSPAGMRRR